MEKVYLIPCLVAGLALVFGINESQAGPYGTNITIYDGKGVTDENNETEPGMTQTQEWDLEGFFLQGSTLTMIGGFDFLKGVSGSQFTSGDIFISTDGRYGYNAASDDTKIAIQTRISGETLGNVVYKDNFGYEYVLDVDWEDSEKSFDFKKLTSNSYTTSAYYYQNEDGHASTSNPFEYVLGGTDVATGTFNYLGKVDDSGFENWKNRGADDHYAVSFDLTDFLDETNLWGSELYFHFTMGCGNDNLIGKGTAPVPEPATMLLFGTGLIGLAGVARRRNK